MPDRIEDCRLLRKNFHDFTSYFGARPELICAGLFADCVLDLPEEVWLEGVTICYTLNDALTMSDVQTRTKIKGKADLKLEVRDKSDTICYISEKDAEHTTEEDFAFRLEEVKLWNPRGFGEQNRYTVRVTALRDGRVLDEREKRIDFRKVETTGNLDFVVNHRPPQLYGANLTPIDGESPFRMNCMRRRTAWGC